MTTPKPGDSEYTDLYRTQRAQGGLFILYIWQGHSATVLH